MSFIPEDKEERKWLMITTVSGIVFYYIVMIFLLVYTPDTLMYYSSFEFEFYYFVSYILIYSILYIIFGMIIGFLISTKIKEVSLIFTRTFVLFFSFFGGLNILAILYVGFFDLEGLLLIGFFGLIYIFSGYLSFNYKKKRSS